MDPSRRIELPAIVLAKAAAHDRLGAGDGGPSRPGGATGWAAALPDVLDELEDRWAMVVGEALPAGTAGFVARARTHDGRDVVLKVAVPDPGFDRQALLLQRAGGRGHVRLLAHDASRSAVLLERLGPSLAESGRSTEDQLSVMCRLLRSTWDVPHDGLGSPVDRASSLARFVADLWEGLDGPCGRDVVDEALRCARSRAAAFDPDGCVLVHGDAACANVLSVTEPRDGAVEGFVLIDPDPFVGDRAYDLGVALRDWCAELTGADRPGALLKRWCRGVAAQSGADAEAVWEWAYLERVSTGLYVCSLGAEELGRPLLDTASMILAERS